jgi:hypothetical protein
VRLIGSTVSWRAVYHRGRAGILPFEASAAASRQAGAVTTRRPSGTTCSIKW